MHSIKSKPGASARGRAVEHRIGIYGLAVPPFSVGGPEHDLEMQVGNVLGRVPRGPDEAEGVTLLDRTPGGQPALVVIEVRVVVHETLIAIGRVNRDATEIVR